MTNTELIKSFPCYPHSFIRMNLEEFKALCKKDSERELVDGKWRFTSKALLNLTYIWNGLFWSGTLFPENHYWELEKVNEFITAVEDIQNIEGMSCCFVDKDEPKERRKLLYNYFKSLKESDIYQHSSYGNVLSIKALILTRLFANLRYPTTYKDKCHPPTDLSLTQMNPENLEKLSKRIKSLIEKDEHSQSQKKNIPH